MEENKLDIPEEVKYDLAEILVGLNANWRSDPDILSYLNELSSFGVNRLNQEPERLSEEKAAVTEQTQELAFNNYKTFIQTAQCSKEIFNDFSIIETQLSSLLENIPKFLTKCNNFGEEADEINTKWQQTSLTLMKHPQLLEILEMPQLMDTCVRNSYYEEALELAAYVHRLNKKHSSIPLISSIAADVQESLNVILRQLLQQLHTNIQLLACLKVVGYLRRMDVFSEVELRVKFLQARNAWFEGILNAVPKSDAYTHIIKTVEASRVHLFDIVTQYRAIFSDDDSLFALSGKYGKQSESSVIHSWVLLRINKFIQILEDDLSRDLLGRIDSVFSQCMYFGLSFSRIGTDFRPLLVPVFQKAIYSKFKYSVQEATNKFEEELQKTVFCSSSLSAVLLNSAIPSDESLHPPMSLLEFTPLAHYCNNILIAFTELRLCVPLGLVLDVTDALQNSLSRLVSSVLDYYIAEEMSLTKNEQTIFSRFCNLIATALLPFLDSCIADVFPIQQLAKLFGITLPEFSKMKGMGRLDIPKLLFPIQYLLPPKEDEGILINVAGYDELDQEKIQLNESELVYDDPQVTGQLVDIPQNSDQDDSNVNSEPSSQSDNQQNVPQNSNQDVIQTGDKSVIPETSSQTDVSQITNQCEVSQEYNQTDISETFYEDDVTQNIVHEDAPESDNQDLKTESAMYPGD